jgi:cell wall-associated NlpC family hydrolase
VGSAPDRRLHAFRPDLADEALRGQVEAERFTRGQPGRIVQGAVEVRRAPDPGSGIDTQMLFGEAVTVFDVRAGYAWVQSGRDGYVGYVDAHAVGDGGPAPATHQVDVPRTFLYPAPDMKTPIKGVLSLTSAVSVVERTEGYARIDQDAWVFADHLAPLGSGAPDHVATARMLLGMPYRWGGKEAAGLDCSALVQVALHRAGRACLRDSDMQAGSVGEAVEIGEPIERGDLLFFPGHVAIALDAERVVHATAFTMQVCEEDLAAVVARVQAESGRGLTAHRRLPGAGRPL